MTVPNPLSYLWCNLSHQSAVRPRSSKHVALATAEFEIGATERAGKHHFSTVSCFACVTRFAVSSFARIQNRIQSYIVVSQFPRTMTIFYYKKLSLLAHSLVTVLLLATNITATARKLPFKIVHLGDSYSAGNGARDANGESDYSSVESCNRSPSNWGSIYAKSLSDNYDVTYINRACSGGVVADITNTRVLDTQFTLTGQCATPSFQEEKIIHKPGSFLCERSIRPQIEAVDATTDLVFLTIGGNDVRLGTIVKSCLIFGLRSADACKAAVAFGQARLDELFDEFVFFFGEMRRRMNPAGQVVYVTYPHLLPNVSYNLQGSDGSLFDAGSAIRALFSRADQLAVTAINAANEAASEPYVAMFNRTKEIFGGHEIDPSILTRNEDRWFREELEGSVVEWFHPNALGHLNWGEGLAQFGTFGVEPSGSVGDTDLIHAVGVSSSESMNDVVEETDSFGLYKRDFSGDGFLEVTSTNQTTKHTFDAALEDHADPHCTSGGGVGLFDEPAASPVIGKVLPVVISWISLFVFWVVYFWMCNGWRISSKCGTTRYKRSKLHAVTHLAAPENMLDIGRRYCRVGLWTFND